MLRRPLTRIELKPEEQGLSLVLVRCAPLRSRCYSGRAPALSPLGPRASCAPGGAQKGDLRTRPPLRRRR